MQTQTIDLLSAAPGVRHVLTVLHFGGGRGPKATIQAALHADEVPALLVAQHLRRRLEALEAAGALSGTVQLVPYANPLGLAQHLLGTHLGRFDLRDGLNFNRGHADLVAAVLERVRGRLADNAAANVLLVRNALRQAAAALPADTPAQDLKRRLVQTAIDSDVVLDLHADGEAAMHLYALTPQSELACELGALLGARAVLLATESGDSPFDEACSRPWLALQQALAPAPLPLACFSATVELRGEADTSHELAAQDAEALIAFLQRRGIVAGVPGPLPTLPCKPTPLAGSEPLSAPVAGVVVYRAAVGDTVMPGTVVADVVDVDTGAVHEVAARSAGVLYARSPTRWATPGKRLGKVAGITLARTGKLLSP
jgi:uncharacterized protein